MNRARFSLTSPLFLASAMAFQGHFGVCQAVKSSEKRCISIDIYLDTVNRTTRLTSSRVSWLDPSKYPVGADGREFELELLLSGGRFLRVPLSSFSITMDEPHGPLERHPTKGLVSTAVYTDEEAIGYRVWNRKTKEFLGQELLPAPKTPPKIEICGGPVQGILVKVGQKVSSIVTLWSTDQGLTWQPLVASGTTGEVAIPSHILPSVPTARTGGMLVEIRVMVGLKLYRERFQLEGTEEALKNGSWMRLQGEHSPIPQRALVSTTQR